MSGRDIRPTDTVHTVSSYLLLCLYYNRRVVILVGLELACTDCHYRTASTTVRAVALAECHWSKVISKRACDRYNVPRSSQRGALAAEA
jgi:hypothetical protein